MKAVKFRAALCVAVILCLFQISEISAQDKTSAAGIKTSTKPEQPETKSAADEDRDSPDIAAGKGKSDERYRIGYQDTIEVNVFRHPELSQVMSVGSDGTISMPRIDQPIVAVCKTERELKLTIENLYKNYLRNPFVNVRAVDQKSQPFAVIGAVEKPGSFYLNRKIRLLELLAFAGGPDVEKSGSKIRIARTGNISACEESAAAENEPNVQFLTYKLKDVMDGSQNPWMQPGDIVSVLDADEAYVVGNVIKPTKISLKEPKTLTQAIAVAGGLDLTAKTDKVIIQRQATGNLEKTELTFDLKDIRENKIPDPQLQANDIVEVSNDKVKSIRNGVLKALTGGVSNLFLRVPVP